MKLVLIDGNSLLFRAFYAMQPMVTKDGTFTQGVFGFLNMLERIRKEYAPERMAVCFDKKGGTFRHEVYAEYKAGRRKTPVELLAQFPLLHEVLEAMDIEILELDRYEADDLLGTVSKAAEEEGMETFIFTSDKDALQLIGENTHVVLTKKGVTDLVTYTPESFLEEYGIRPAQFVDLKALMGDSSDNLKGVTGVGLKKGTQLLVTYGSLDGIYEHKDEIKGKLGENIRAEEEQARMTRFLATIDREAPIDFSFDRMEYAHPDEERLVDIYRRLEFRSFLEKLGKGGRKDEAKDMKPLQEISWEDFFAKTADEPIVLDMVTNNDHLSSPAVSSVRVMAEKEGLYAVKTLCFGEEKEALQPLSESGRPLIGHSLRSALYTLAAYDLPLLPVLHDTEVAEYLIDPNRSKYPLSRLGRIYAEMTIEDDEKGKKKAQTSLIPEEEDREEIMKRLRILAASYHGQEERLEELGLTEVYETCEKPLISLMVHMERDGVAFRPELLTESREAIDARLKELEENIYEEAGKKFNILSPKQLGVVLFEDLGIPYPKGKKTSSYSTAQDILDRLKDAYPIAADVLEYRKYAKLKSTYIDGLKLLVAEDGRIHPHFNQTVAATGRLSCTEPNLQNIPIRDRFGRGIRKAFVAADGCIFIGADYSQIELRILAALSGDEALIESFRKGEDIHRRTASRVFGIPFDEVTPLDRSRAKAINFGIIYGMSAFGLSEDLHISVGEADRYIHDYFEKHPKVKEYLDGLIEEGKENLEVRTLMGRIRQIPEFRSSRYNERQLAQRLAMNTPIQGSAADIMKLAMIRVGKALEEQGLRSKLILQIHDELIIEAREEEAETVKTILREGMEHAVSLAVQLPVEINEGATLYDLK